MILIQQCLQMIGSASWIISSSGGWALQGTCSSSSSESSENMKENCSTPQEPNLCSYFKQNRCQFGISGKGCKFSHPKRCQKLLSHGKSSHRGCTKEEKCKFFHPPMCRYSLRNRICSNLDCQFMHIKGTQRYQPAPVKDARNVLNKKTNSIQNSYYTL